MEQYKKKRDVENRIKQKPIDSGWKAVTLMPTYVSTSNIHFVIDTDEIFQLDNREHGQKNETVFFILLTLNFCDRLIYLTT